MISWETQQGKERERERERGERERERESERAMKCDAYWA